MEKINKKIGIISFKNKKTIQHNPLYMNLGVNPPSPG
jgi:hypothetical protein